MVWKERSNLGAPSFLVILALRMSLIDPEGLSDLHMATHDGPGLLLMTLPQL